MFQYNKINTLYIEFTLSGLIYMFVSYLKKLMFFVMCFTND